MPRNGQGVYSLPPVYEAVTGETIEAQQHNTPLEDIAFDLNQPRSVATGGTGGASATQARNNLDVYSTTEVDEKITSTITGAPEKETPVDADGFAISDSADTNKPKRVLWSKIKSTLKTYFDTLYAGINDYLKLAGGTMTGPLVLSGAPTDNLHPATKKYVDDLGALKAALAGNNIFTGINEFKTQLTIKADGVPQYRLANAAGSAAAIFYVDTTTNFAKIETYTFAGAVWNSFSIEGGGYNAFKMNGAIAWNKGNLFEGLPADISGSNASYKVFTGAQIESRIQAVAQAWVPFQAAGYFSTTIVNTGYVWQNATGKPVMITGSIIAGGQAIAEISANGSAFEQIAGASASSGASANFSIMIPPAWFFRFQSVSGSSYSLKLQRF